MDSPATPEFLQLQEAVAGRFSLERELGRGGMAIVFLARDVALDRPVAIKLLPEARAAEPDLRERFLREARTSAKLSHPNIVPIHLVETRGDLVYFVMTYVDGETLGQRVRRAGPLSASQATRLVQEVAWALAYAHGRGVVHRDVKPDNILIDKDSGRAMVTDFGIASVLGTGTMSRSGEIVGTAHYMSPEQAKGETVDGRSDLFSLGITAFYALTGTLPFEGPHLPAVVMRIVNDPAPNVGVVRPGVPAILASAVDRCLAKRPDARFESGEALAEAVAPAVVSNEVAPQLRYFIKSFQSIDASLAFVVAGILVVPMWSTLWRLDRPTIVALLYLAVAPIVFGFGLVVYAARQVVNAGLGVDDARRALERELRARREEVESVSLGSAADVDRIARRRGKWRWMGHLGLAGMFASVITGRVLGLPSGPVRGSAILSGVLGALGYLGAMSLTRHLKRRAKSTPALLTLGSVADRLIQTPVAVWLFRAAGVGLDVHAQNTPPLRERTEVLVASEVSRLWSRLPRALRGRFADVPLVIRRLENEADDLRRRQGLVASPAAAERVGERLATAVAAIESIRLDLLRLEAGVGTPDDLTAHLLNALAISEAVDAELGAQSQALGTPSQPLRTSL